MLTDETAAPENSHRWATRNLYLAAFMITSGGSKLADVVARRDPKQIVNSKPLVITLYNLQGGGDERLGEAYKEGKTLVPAHAFAERIKYLDRLGRKAREALLLSEVRARREAEPAHA